MVYGDGSTLDPKDERLSRGGSGVFYGINHPDNLAEPTIGELQSSYSAELFALLLATEKSAVPMHYVADNKAVIEQAEALAVSRAEGFAKEQADSLQCGWMWERVASRIRDKPAVFFLYTWQRSHVKEKHLELVEAGIYSQQEADWNDEADRLADMGAEKNAMHPRVLKAAWDRTLIAKLTHRMYLGLWTERVKDIGMEAEAENDQLEGELGHPDFFDLNGDDFGFDGDGLDQSPLGGPASSTLTRSTTGGPPYDSTDTDRQDQSIIDIVETASTSVETSVTSIQLKPSGRNLSHVGIVIDGGPGPSRASGRFQTPYLRMVHEYPRYPWGLPLFRDTVRISTGTVATSWGGRPIFRAGANHSFEKSLWTPFIKYLNLLMWWEQEEDYAGVMSNATTFVELVLDFELFTGQRVEDDKMGGSITWLRKAAVFANMYKAALKYTKGPPCEGTNSGD